MKLTKQEKYGIVTIYFILFMLGYAYGKLDDSIMFVISLFAFCIIIIYVFDGDDDG